MTYQPIQVRAKNLIKKVLPVAVFKIVQSTWRHTFSRMIDQTKTVSRYTDDFISKHGYSILGGPFKGLQYVHEAAGSNYLAKLVGSYEEVLHPFIEASKGRKYSTIIDIGCAEGYYLIGLGKFSPSSRLVGYDIDKKALALTRELYEINHLTNELMLVERCTPEDLTSRIDDNALLICDAEGFENVALDVATTPRLKNIKTFIIELHDFAVPGIKDILIDRFKETHAVEVVRFRNADASKYPYYAAIKSKSDLYTILRERGEQEQEWLILEKKW